MTLDDFIKKWTGQPVDFDGVYPNQFMDLMHQYVYDVLGVKDARALAQPAAYQVYTNFSSDFDGNLFDQIENTPTNVPQKGDIILFGQAIGPYGHVCVFVSGDASNFKSFDANWPGGSLPHVQDHTYNGVLGWLRFKNPVITAPAPTSGYSETQAMGDATDAYLGQRYNDDEINQWIKMLSEGKNMVDFFKALMGDSRFINRVIQPSVDSAVNQIKDANSQQTTMIEDLRKQLAGAQETPPVIDEPKVVLTPDTGTFMTISRPVKPSGIWGFIQSFFLGK